MSNVCTGDAQFTHKRQRSSDTAYPNTGYPTRCSKRSRLNEQLYHTKAEKITECPPKIEKPETECSKVELSSEELIKQTLLSLNTIFSKPVRVSWSTVEQQHPLHNVTLVTSPELDDESDIQEELEDLLEAWERSRAVLREE